MKPLRLSVYFQFQLGFMISFTRDYNTLTIALPFVNIYLNLIEGAKGVRFFRDKAIDNA